MNNKTVVKMCVIFGVLNLVLVSGLAAGGVLKSVQQDTQKFYTQESAERTIQLPEETNRPFIGELIVDTDAYYNAVIRAENGISIYPPPETFNQYTQRYHYAPIIVLVFSTLAIFGYLPFKILLLIVSITSVVVGSYAILRVEATARDYDISDRILVFVSISMAGFGPMVSNYKVGQISPLIYLTIAGCWYWYRQDQDIPAGAALTFAVLTKPYFLAPAAILIARKRIKAIVGVVSGVLAGYGIGVVSFGVDTLYRYFWYLRQGSVGKEGGNVPEVAAWSVEAVYPFFSFNPLPTLGRFLAFVGFASLWVQYLRSNAQTRDAVGVFSGSLVMVMLLIQQASNMDLAVCLAAYVVLGPELYDRGRGFKMLGVSFILMTVHPYAMEVLVGAGHINLITLTNGPSQILLQFLQPAVYGLYILAGLSAFVVFRPVTESKRI
jgi:hypothetical protein